MWGWVGGSEIEWIKPLVPESRNKFLAKFIVFFSPENGIRIADACGRDFRTATRPRAARERVRNFRGFGRRRAGRRRAVAHRHPAFALCPPPRRILKSITRQTAQSRISLANLPFARHAPHTSGTPVPRRPPPTESDFAYDSVGPASTRLRPVVPVSHWKSRLRASSKCETPRRFRPFPSSAERRGRIPDMGRMFNGF